MCIIIYYPSWAVYSLHYYYWLLFFFSIMHSNSGRRRPLKRMGYGGQLRRGRWPETLGL